MKTHQTVAVYILVGYISVVAILGIIILGAY